MSEVFETVLAVDDYYDGPRIGIANFNGVPHRFRSFGWLSDVDECGWSDDYDMHDDRFLLAPADSPPDHPGFVVRGQFRVRRAAPDLPPGVIRPLEVRWFEAS